MDEPNAQFPILLFQALHDNGLSRGAKALLPYAILRLSYHEFREQKMSSFAVDAQTTPEHCARCLAELVRRGYLDVHAKQRPRAYRLNMTRRTEAVRAA